MKQSLYFGILSLFIFLSWRICSPFSPHLAHLIYEHSITSLPNTSTSIALSGKISEPAKKASLIHSHTNNNTAFENSWYDYLSNSLMN